MVAVPSQQTWIAGNTLLSSQLNDDIRDAINFLLDPPCFAGYTAADATIASASTFSADRALTEVKDNDGMHSGTDSFVTIQTQGRYLVVGWASFEANVTGTRGVQTMLNGARLSTTRIRASENGIWADDTTIEIDLEVGDLISLQVMQNSGGGILCNGGASPYATGLAVRWVGLGD